MNQEKSNLASSPARLARLVMRMSSPLQCEAKTSRGSMTGRPLEEEGSWSRTRWASHWAKMTKAFLAGLITQDRQRRQWRQRQAITVCAGGLGLQAQVLGCAAAWQCRWAPEGTRAQLVRQQRRIGCNLGVEARDGAQRDETDSKQPQHRVLLSVARASPWLQLLPTPHLDSSNVFLKHQDT